MFFFMKISSSLGQAVKRKCHFLTYEISLKIDFSIFKIRKVIGDKLGISSLVYEEVVKLLLFLTLISLSSFFLRFVMCPLLNTFRLFFDFACCSQYPMSFLTPSPLFYRTLTEINKSAPCNSLCHCNSREYDPVCGVDELSYFSPCHAGCIRNMDGRKEVKLTAQRLRKPATLNT